MVAGASTELLVDVLETKPLRLHASLHHPDAAQEVAWVPRLLLPAGAFIRVSVRDAADEQVYETNTPKFKPKMKPGDDSSYGCLDPGYSYGTVFDLDLDLGQGRYRIEVSYSNLDFRGTSNRPVGNLELSQVREVEVEAHQSDAMQRVTSGRQ